MGFVAIYATLFAFFKPELIFSATTTTGGDTGAHHYVADFLINHLLPQGRITGWSPGWYAGFPMLHFYFPFPFLVIAFLSTIIKYEIAFKIGTILGVFLLPLTTYAAFRVLKFRFPFPIIGAAFSLLFLFMESYSIYGGNILSTLAGEFGYSLSFSLTFLFLALLYRDVSEEKLRVSTGVLLGIIALSHLVTTLMIVILAAYYLFNRINIKRFGILAAVFGLGFALSAFWGVPFVAKLGYTAHMEWDQLKGISDILPAPLRPFIALSAIGVTGALAKRDRRMYFYVWAVAVAAALFFVLPPGRLWNGRLLPFFYFFSFMWAAYGLWFVRKVLAQLFYEYALIPRRYGDYAVAALATITMLISVFGADRVADDWIRWNYSGFEGKEHWATFNSINRYIKKLPPGRVMVEHSTKIDKFGTPRAFELLPYFADHPTMEGTLMEASHTAPFHFVNQAELSKEPSNAILGVTYPPLDVNAGVRHLKLYNIPYFLATSDEVIRAARKHPDLKLLKRWSVAGEDLKFALFQTETDGYVVIPEKEPVLVETDDWRQTALDWYADPRRFAAPLVDADHARSIGGAQRFASPHSVRTSAKIEATQAAIHDVRLTDDELTFTTSAVGVPHWIKISYFPNWKAEGADGPYLASPSLMLVVPTQRHVRLYYGNTTIDTVSAVLSTVAWLFALGYGAVFVWKRARIRLRSRGETQGSRAAGGAADAREGRSA